MKLEYPELSHHSVPFILVPHCLMEARGLPKIGFILLSTIGVILIFLFEAIFSEASTGLYHSDEGLICGDCHTFYNSENTQLAEQIKAQNPALLTQPSITDLCLKCHLAKSDLKSKAPAVMTVDGFMPSGISMPAGDFYWSARDAGKGHNPGRTHAMQSSLIPSDQRLATSPGGNFQTNEWDCTTCHDPHNRFGANVSAWRQLKRNINGVVHTGNETPAFGVETNGGNQGPSTPGYEPIKSNSRGYVVSSTNPADYVMTRLDGNPLEGADLFARASDANKNVYRGGFSSFCSVCHGDFHGGQGESGSMDNGKTNSGGNWVRHPSNMTMEQSTGKKYGINTYRAAILNEQGNNPNPIGYDWKYPLAKGDSDFLVKSRVSSAGDPATLADTDRIMCLTCHRAHASPYENMTRWDTENHSFIANGAKDHEGEFSTGDNPAYGCAKCHQLGGVVAFVKRF